MVYFVKQIFSVDNNLGKGPSVNHFDLCILWKPQHHIFIFCWNSCWELQSNLGSLLQQCSPEVALTQDPDMAILSCQVENHLHLTFHKHLQGQKMINHA